MNSITSFHFATNSDTAEFSSTRPPQGILCGIPLPHFQLWPEDWISYIKNGHFRSLFRNLLLPFSQKDQYKSWQAYVSPCSPQQTSALDPWITQSFSGEKLSWQAHFRNRRKKIVHSSTLSWYAHLHQMVSAADHRLESFFDKHGFLFLADTYIRIVLNKGKKKKERVGFDGIFWK